MVAKKTTGTRVLFKIGNTQSKALPSKRKMMQSAVYSIVRQQQQWGWVTTAVVPSLLFRRRRRVVVVQQFTYRTINTSASTCNNDEDLNDPPYDNKQEGNHNSIATSMIQHRPRLEALRERLQKDGLLIRANKNDMVESRTIRESDSDVTVDHHRHRHTKSRRTRIQQQAEQIDVSSSSSSSLAANEVDPSSSSSILVDRFGRRHSYLRLSLTERCNLRCTYCMPENGLPELPPYLLTTDQLLSIAHYFYTRGVSKFRLTGGEPTLRSDLIEIVAGLKQLHPDQVVVGMTTNGIALNERKLLDLEAAGLTHLNISLDTLDPDQFAKITRRPYFSKVWKTLQAAVENTNLSVKINCVIQRHVNQDQVAPMVRLLSKFPNVHIRFIEYMPFADNAWNFNQCVPYRELLNDLAQNHDIHLQAIPSDDPHDTTKWYRDPSIIASTGGTGTGKIGFITSMSHHFCASCNRLRITADGLLKVCLFDTEQSTVDLRHALLHNIPLDDIVGPALQRKHSALGGHGNPIALGQSSAFNRPMTRIGG
jgi:molybdenum cofactor biosynthesis protein A